MKRFLKLIILELVQGGTQMMQNTDVYNDQFLDAFCNDKKERDTLICQPMYNTQQDQNFYTQNNQQVPSNQYQQQPVKVNPPQVAHPVQQQQPIVQQPVQQPLVQQPVQQPIVQQQPVKINPPTQVPPHTSMTIQSQPITQKTSATPKNLGQKLSIVLSENPIARNQLINFLDYTGVPPPWDQLLDFETTQHHQLPDPDNLFRKIRKQLLTFDKVKTCIVEALIVIEKYINRGKAYLSEDLKDLCRDKILLKNILKRLNTKPAYEFRSELFKRFADIKCKSTSTEKSFYKLRDWLMRIKKLFATL